MRVRVDPEELRRVAEAARAERGRVEAAAAEGACWCEPGDRAGGDGCAGSCAPERQRRAVRVGRPYKTPDTHPDHETVGRAFRGWDGRIYYCDAYDPSCGFWMRALGDPPRRTNVSEAAIGRTFHRIFDDGL